jgi:hypothetical protein
MPVNDFAVPRMEPSKQRPVQSMEEVRDADGTRASEQGVEKGAHRGEHAAARH